LAALEAGDHGLGDPEPSRELGLGEAGGTTGVSDDAGGGHVFNSSKAI
jgi:hypothetical protein